MSVTPQLAAGVLGTESTLLVATPSAPDPAAGPLFGALSGCDAGSGNAGALMSRLLCLFLKRGHPPFLPSPSSLSPSALAVSPALFRKLTKGSAISCVCEIPLRPLWWRHLGGASSVLVGPQ